MSERYLPLPRAITRIPSDIWLAAGCLAILVSLSLADRLVAWLIGAYPSAAILWQIRFEYLRPVGVYYDYMAMISGGVSPVQFAGIVIALAILVAAGAQSRILLVRALCWHGLLAAALLLLASSWPGMEAPAGHVSTPYAILGGILSLPLALMCLRLHIAFLRAPAPHAEPRTLFYWAADIVRRTSFLVSAPQPALLRIATRDRNAKR